MLSLISILQMMKHRHKGVKKPPHYHPAGQQQRKNLNLGILASESLLTATTLHCCLTDDLKSLPDTDEVRISELEDKFKETDNIKVIVRRNTKKSLRKDIIKVY